MIKQIYVYDTEPECNKWTAFCEWLNGMRYMALEDKPYPHGRILEYGRTRQRALEKAQKKLRQEKYRRRPTRKFVDVWTVEI